MPYTVTATALPEVLILEPKVFGDERGFFFESFNARDFAKATGLERNFVQDNHSKSAQGVLRGLHSQKLAQFWEMGRRQFERRQRAPALGARGLCAWLRRALRNSRVSVQNNRLLCARA
jgi:hypothetical protein